jgi:hypothetical protein
MSSFISRPLPVIPEEIDIIEEYDDDIVYIPDDDDGSPRKKQKKGIPIGEAELRTILYGVHNVETITQNPISILPSLPSLPVATPLPVFSSPTLRPRPTPPTTPLFKIGKYILDETANEIYNSISNDELKKKFLKDLAKDDATIEELETDNLYNYYDNFCIGVGRKKIIQIAQFIEEWICVNLKCPVCKEGILEKYSKKNHPVVDVRCSNENHINTKPDGEPILSPSKFKIPESKLFYGVKCFQIKASRLGATFYNHDHKEISKYFNINPNVKFSDNYIHIGSINYGFKPHIVKPSDRPETKELSIGYMCIQFEYTIGTDSISILPEQSFCIMPNLELSKKDNTRLNDYYYKYFKLKTKKDKKNSHPRIKFNPNTCIVKTFTEEYPTSINDFKDLSLNITFNRTTYTGITALDPNEFRKKYLKYKNKYLKLKQKLKQN